MINVACVTDVLKKNISSVAAVNDVKARSFSKDLNGLLVLQFNYLGYYTLLFQTLFIDETFTYSHGT